MTCCLVAGVGLEYFLSILAQLVPELLPEEGSCPTWRLGGEVSTPVARLPLLAFAGTKGDTINFLSC